MKKLLAAALTGGLALGIAGIASAAPDPTGPAKHGLCTAYFNGSETGRANKRGAPPFVALETAAGGAGDAVADFCGVTEDSNGSVGGNPDFGETGGGNNNRGGNK